MSTQTHADTNYRDERVGVCASCKQAIDLYSSVMAKRELCRCPVIRNIEWLGYPPRGTRDEGQWRETFRGPYRATHDS
jgi:hypothetical protein